MITTWQKIIIVLICIFLGGSVGYILIKNNVKKIDLPSNQNHAVNTVFNQYVTENNNTNNNIK
ncbi:MAG: hypothetical protein IKF17_01800 [Clostridia bacterium]|nr:hypothetical protein [Clostridia bacterium]